MPTPQFALLQIGALESLARRDSWIHRRDARAKVLTTFLFILTVISFQRYEIAGLAPLALFPVVMISMSGISARTILLRLLVAAPFMVMVGVLNPLIDRATALRLGPLVISAGWLSFASILLRFALSLSAGLILISTTGLDGVCAALGRLGAPRIFTVQLMLLFRYLFVMTDESARILRAWTLRAPGARLTPRLAATLMGQLLLRALDRAHRVHMAMLSRGFTGEIRAGRALRMSLGDAMFFVAWASFFAAVRYFDVTRWLGQAALGPGR